MPRRRRHPHLASPKLQPCLLPPPRAPELAAPTGETKIASSDWIGAIRGQQTRRPELPFIFGWLGFWLHGPSSPSSSSSSFAVRAHDKSLPRPTLPPWVGCPARTQHCICNTRVLFFIALSHIFDAEPVARCREPNPRPRENGACHSLRRAAALVSALRPRF